jgi:hypothetical protein
MHVSIQPRWSLTSTLILVAALMWSLTASARAASVPPTWSPMAMLNVSYNAAAQRLDVMDEAASSKLGVGIYPVLVLDTLSTGNPNPGSTVYGTFADPWSALNGKAFSRMLGWYDPNSTKTDGTALKDEIQAAYTINGVTPSIWIQLESRSDGLESFLAVGKYGVNANNTQTVDATLGAYSPIFVDVNSKWHWDYQMDHNAYAVSGAYLTSPNQLFTATYKVYVGDAQGNEILNADGSSPSCEEIWTWQGPSFVPEPAGLTLLLAGVAARWRRRR